MSEPTRGPRPRLLFLSQCLPYPPTSGVTNRTFHILREAQREFDVTLLAFSRRNHQSTAAARRAAEEAMRGVVARVVESVPIGAEHSRVRRLRDHARSVLSRRPYVYDEYDDPVFLERLRAELARAPVDLVHLDSLDLQRWLPELPDVPVAVTHHAIESELLQLRAEVIRPRILGAYLHHQARLLERSERELCGRVDVNLMMSTLDGERLRALAPGARTVAIPNGVDAERLAPRGGEVVPGEVLFMGPAYMFPNRDAIEWLLDEVWPAVRSQVPEATLALVGKTQPALQAAHGAHAGVEVRGFVDDVRPHLARAACCVAPLRVGGGTRLKILDYWAMARPVVATTIGCEGLDVVDGENILVRDDAAGTADAIVRVLRDPELAARLGAAGRRTVDRTYTWQMIGDTLLATYRSLLAAPAEVQRASTAR